MTADGCDPAFERMRAAMIFAGPEFVIVGRPNGSGRTTTSRRVAAACEGLYIGADAISAEMNPADPLSVRIAASNGFVHGSGRSSPATWWPRRSGTLARS